MNKLSQLLSNHINLDQFDVTGIAVSCILLSMNATAPVPGDMPTTEGTIFPPDVIADIRETHEMLIEQSDARQVMEVPFSHRSPEHE